LNEWIERYATGCERLAEALVGLGDDLLMFKPAPNAWSIKEIAVHLTDTELVALYRMKAVIAEDNPTLLNFDQDAWAARLRYAEADLNAAMQQFKALRETFVPTLRLLRSEDWERIGTHNQAGVLKLSDLLMKFVNHVEDHIRQIDRNKAAFKALRQA
jgi:uncharacterized damage-inducible protein DinB